MWWERFHCVILGSLLSAHVLRGWEFLLVELSEVGGFTLVCVEEAAAGLLPLRLYCSLCPKFALGNVTVVVLLSLHTRRGGIQ